MRIKMTLEKLKRDVLLPALFVFTEDVNKDVYVQTTNNKPFNILPGQSRATWYSKGNVDDLEVELINTEELREFLLKGSETIIEVDKKDKRKVIKVSTKEKEEEPEICTPRELSSLSDLIMTNLSKFKNPSTIEFSAGTGILSVRIEEN